MRPTDFDAPQNTGACSGLGAVVAGDLAAGDLHCAARVAQVAVDGIDVADDELQEHAPGCASLSAYHMRLRSAMTGRAAYSACFRASYRTAYRPNPNAR